ncbi:MAG TPA: hypothetical protein VJC16_02155 [Candidatus Nanoarchaeia archaeon]|nr:hypothetical protein [Candidatus Nanoarchaeia archaeon]
MDYRKLIGQKTRELQQSGRRTAVIKIGDSRNLKVNPLRLAFNRAVIALSWKIVPSHFKNWLLRRTGLHIGHDACLPNDIVFDPYFPELITIEDGALIGAPNTIMAHSYRAGKLTIGKVLVKKRVLVGAFSSLQPGAVVHEQSILNMGAELRGEVPAGQLWGGRPAAPWKKFDAGEIEKYFQPSSGRHAEYYQEAKEKIRQFRRDPSANFLKIPYNGRRLNAGDDWWRARSVLRIFYNGAIIETARLLPHCLLKTSLLRMAGVKIGKRVMIGKGVVFDHIYCDLTTIEDDVHIGNDCQFGGHEYTITQTIFGRVTLKQGAALENNVLVRAGSTIGEGALVEAGSAVSKEVPAHERWGGVPARFIARLR